MNKLFGLFLLAIAFLAPDAAYAVNCFWVGGTGPWTSASIANWAPTTGGAATGCQTSNAAPAAGDTITFDSSSGGGTATPDSSINGIAFGALSAGGYTNGTLAFNTNNPSPTFASVSFTGAVTRTINMGSGTWTITGSTSTIFTVATATGLTDTFQNATIAFTATTSNTRFFLSAGKTFGAFTVSNNTSLGIVSMTGANTFASMTIGSGTTIGIPVNTTTTISGASTFTGTAAAPSGIIGDSLGNGNTATISFSAGTTTMVWGALVNITTAGAGTFTATNSFNNRTVLDAGDTISPPSGSGGGGGRIIGG